VSQVAVAPLRTTARPPGPATGRRTQPRREANGNGRSDVVMAAPRKDYSTRSDERDGLVARLRNLRGRRLKIAIVTGLLAFVVAVAAVTLPELIFGGSVSSGGRTTFFGGSDSSSQDGEKRDGDRDGSSGQEQQPTDPAQPRDSTEPVPEEAEPVPEETEPAPEETEPAPPSGGQPAPPEGGTPATPVPAPQAPAP
jgi:hypothetical protein